MICPECKSENNRVCESDIICADCGIVLDEGIVGEGSRFGDDEGTFMVGGMPVLPKNISAGFMYTPEERKYINGKRDLDLASSYLGLTRFVEREVRLIWQYCVWGKFCTGRKLDHILAACVYLGGLVHGVSIDLEKLMECFSETNIKPIMETARALNKEQMLELVLPDSVHATMVKYCERLNLPEEAFETAFEILEVTPEITFSRKKEVVSLGIIHLVNQRTELGIKLIDLCRLGDVSAESINDVCRILRRGHDGKD